MCLARAELQSLQASVYGRHAKKKCTALAEHELNKREDVMDKQSKASELNAGIRSTIEQLANETDAARQSDLFRNYLKTSAAFYDYSWHNQMLIWKQRADDRRGVESGRESGVLRAYRAIRLGSNAPLTDQCLFT